MKDYARSRSSNRKVEETSGFNARSFAWLFLGVIIGSFLTVILLQSPTLHLNRFLAPKQTLALTHKPSPSASSKHSKPLAPHFDFYTMLPKNTPSKSTLAVKKETSTTNPVVAEKLAPVLVAKPAPIVAEKKMLAPPRKMNSTLQLAAFRKRCDADRLRAKLLLLGFSPKIREITTPHGPWCRVYLGPYENEKRLKVDQLKLAENHQCSIVVTP